MNRFKKYIKEKALSQEHNSGEWIPIPYEIEYGSDAECPFCHGRFINAINYNYCPNCGAKMKRENNEMTNYEYSKVGEPSEKAIDILESMFEDLHILDCEKEIYKNLMIALIRNERLNAAVEYYDICRYNK